jgi:regulator of protease activity HflC (stomatin/prohibitin superfamily)
MAKPGLNFKIPFTDRVVHRINMRIQEIQVQVETKTEDNVFVRLAVAVQYQVHDPYNAFYKLSNPRGQITSYVFDAVRAKVPLMKLDLVFEAKDEIADTVREQLAGTMDDFGYTIIKALVVDIDPDQEVKDSMNRINAAERLKVAAKMEAEADKIRKVTAAEAEAESKHLQGIGVARQRKAIADGLSESAGLVKEHMDGVTSESVMALLLMTQYFDTLQAMSEQSGTRTIFLPHSPGGMSSLQEQIQQAMMIGNQVK